jgi:dipeptidyl aminopeptidase/acylaminoacyl peptidase
MSRLPLLLTAAVLGIAPLLPGPHARTDPAKAAVLTVEQAIAVYRPSDPQFSPDGKKLAFSVSRPPKGTTRGQEIWVLDVATRDLRRFAHSAKSDRHPRWSPDGKKLAFLSDRQERSQIHLIPTDGGEAERLTEGKHAVTTLEWSPDGKHIAFLAAEPKTQAEEKKATNKDDARVVDADDKPVRLWVVEVASKKVRPLTTGRRWVSSLAWAPQGDRLFVLATDHHDEPAWKDRFFSVALKDGAMKELHSPAGPVRSLAVSPDGAFLSYIGARGDGPSPHDLFVRPVAGGAPRNLTAGGLDRHVDFHLWQRDGRLLLAAEEGFRTRLATWTAEGKEVSTPGYAAVNLSAFASVARADNGLVAFVGQEATQPPEVWLLPPGGPAECVSKFNDGLRGRKLVRPEFFRYTSFDGTPIEASLYRPDRPGKPGKAPLVVLVHGGPTGRWSDGYDVWAQLLAARGFAVFCPNIRGSTGYGWKFLTRNRSDWGGGDFKDVMAGVDDLVRRGIADPDRLGIGGWSYGGYMAAWAITQTRRFKAAVVGAGMSDLASEFGTENVQTAAYDRWFYGVPYEKPEGFVKSSPVTYVKNARTPTLILHGENDRVDPIGQAQQFHRGLRLYNVPCEFVVYPREGHGLAEERHQLDYLRRIVRWFETHLK